MTLPWRPQASEPSEERIQAGQLDRFVAFAFAAADMLLEITAAGQITFAAGAFRAHLSKSPEALVGRNVADLVAARDRPVLATALTLLAGQGRLKPTALRLANEKRAPFALSGLSLTSPEGAGRLCLSLAAMPAPLESAVEGLESASGFERDAEARFRAAFAEAASGDTSTLHLGLIEVNTALITSADLRDRVDAALVRAVGPAGSGASLGPGRYGVLSHQSETILDLAGLVTDIEAALGLHGQEVSIRTHALPLTAIQRDGLSPTQAVRALRHALTVFAREGSSGLPSEAGDGGLKAVVAGMTAKAGALRRTLGSRNFRLEFQPIVDLQEGGVLHHVEALIRPPQGLLGPKSTPYDFVTLAEAVGLSEELDIAVAEQVILAAAGSTCPIALNLSGLSVQSAAFRGRLLGCLDAARDARRRIMVELTESAEIENEAEAGKTLAALRDRGMPICLDDFGAGAAAFRYIKTFKVDYVKVDGSFVRAAASEKRDRSVLTAMVDLSCAMGAKVIAEHVETEEGAAVMRDLGVHLGQGWLYGRPGPLPSAKPPPAGSALSPIPGNSPSGSPREQKRELENRWI